MKYIVNIYILFPALFVLSGYFWVNGVYGIYLLSMPIFVKNAFLFALTSYLAANITVPPRPSSLGKQVQRRA